VSRLTPDAGYTAWQGAIHEGLSRFLYKKTKRRPLILPLVTEV
jgi:mRNA degradation ribonuclease J1/J2